jgi:hypothetical protein
MLRDFFTHLAAKRNPGGVHSVYRAVHAFCNWLALEFDDFDNPMPRVKIRSPKARALPGVPLEDIRRMMMVLRGATRAMKYNGAGDKAIEMPDWPTRLAAVKLHMGYLAAPVVATQRVEVTRVDGPTVEDQMRSLQSAGTDLAGIVSSWLATADPALREKAVDIQAVVDI